MIELLRQALARRRSRADQARVNAEAARRAEERFVRADILLRGPNLSTPKWKALVYVQSLAIHDLEALGLDARATALLDAANAVRSRGA